MRSPQASGEGGALRRGRPGDDQHHYSTDEAGPGHHVAFTAPQGHGHHQTQPHRRQRQEGFLNVGTEEADAARPPKVRTPATAPARHERAIIARITVTAMSRPPRGAPQRIGTPSSRRSPERRDRDADQGRRGGDESHQQPGTETARRPDGQREQQRGDAQRRDEAGDQAREERSRADLPQPLPPPGRRGADDGCQSPRKEPDRHQRRPAAAASEYGGGKPEQGGGSAQVGPGPAHAEASGETADAEDPRGERDEGEQRTRHLLVAEGEQRRDSGGPGDGMDGSRRPQARGVPPSDEAAERRRRSPRAGRIRPMAGRTGTPPAARPATGRTPGGSPRWKKSSRSRPPSQTALSSSNIRRRRRRARNRRAAGGRSYSGSGTAFVTDLATCDVAPGGDGRCGWRGLHAHARHNEDPASSDRGGGSSASGDPRGRRGDHPDEVMGAV